MKQPQLFTVTVDGAEYTYPSGTTFAAIAADFQDRYPYDILLVERDGKLCELGKSLDRCCHLRMITALEKPGMMTYERSAVFLMLKAFCDVAGRGRIGQI